jgi:hypothetical protein
MSAEVEIKITSVADLRAAKAVEAELQKQIMAARAAGKEFGALQKQLDAVQRGIVELSFEEYARLALEYNSSLALSVRGDASRSSVQSTALTDLPALARKFTSSVFREARHRLTGEPPLSSEDIAARLSICATCPARMGEMPLARCRACGCFLAAKSRFASESCPLQKWPNPAQSLP